MPCLARDSIERSWLWIPVPAREAASRNDRGNMPAIKPDRVLGDLYKLRTFGTYKTGVHRPTFSPDDIAARNWFAEQCTAAGLETTIDGIGNIFGKSKATRRQGAVRLASGKPEPCRLARRAARLRLCARGVARDQGGGRRRGRRRRGVLRRGRPFRLVPRSEVVHRPARRTRTSTRRRNRTTARRCATRWPRPATPGGRA